MIKRYKHLEDVLLNSLEHLTGFICSSPCCYDEHIWDSSPHSYVNLNRFMWEGKGFSAEGIDKFESDIEHGVFHGLMTYLIATILDSNLVPKLQKEINNGHEGNINRDKDFLQSRFRLAKESNSICLSELKVIPSCLFHDAYRTIFAKNEHDKKLREYFPNLDESTYQHSNPSDGKSILVKSDRVELLRYNDFNVWVNLSTVFEDIPEDKIELIYLFYLKIRPALEKCYTGRNKRWIRHGLEADITKFDFKESYPTEYLGFWNQKKDTKIVLGSPNKLKANNFWSVEIGNGPLNGCFTRERCKYKDVSKLTFMKETPLHEKLQGKIPMDTFKSFKGNSLHPCIFRDHLVAHGECPIEEWAFTYTDLSPEEFEFAVESDISLCSEELLDRTLNVTSKIIDLMHALKTNCN